MANWWESGKRYRVVVTRAVSDEETVSVEALHDAYADAAAEAQAFVRVCHRLRKEWNRTVHKQQVVPYRQELAALEQQLMAKHAELARLDQAHAGAIVEHEAPAVNGVAPYGD